MAAPPFTNYEDLGNPAAHAMRGNLFQFAHIADVAQSATYYYSFVAPSDKEIILFDRTLMITEGPGLVFTRTLPDTVTHGDPIFVMNCWLDKRTPDTQFYADSTNVTGGIIAVPELLASGAHKGGGFGQRGGMVIIPRNTVGAVEVQNNSNQDAEFHFWVFWAEADLYNIGKDL
jgi:hypothetical protein